MFRIYYFRNLNCLFITDRITTKHRSRPTSINHLDLHYRHPDTLILLRRNCNSLLLPRLTRCKFHKGMCLYFLYNIVCQYILNSCTNSFVFYIIVIENFLIRILSWNCTQFSPLNNVRKVFCVNASLHFGRTLIINYEAPL